MGPRKSNAKQKLGLAALLGTSGLAGYAAKESGGDVIEKLTQLLKQSGDERIYEEIIKQASGSEEVYEFLNSMEKIANFVGMDIEVLAEVVDYISQGR